MDCSMPDDELHFSDNQPTRADALKNRALLLETAGRLFAEQGVGTVSMTAIAEAAGVGKGTLYRHFDNKTALCHALLDQEMRDLQERALRRLRVYDDPLADLRWFVGQVIRFVNANADLLCVQAGTETAAAFEYPAHLWWRQTIRGLLGRIAPPGDLDYLADVIYIMLDVRTIDFQMNTLGYDLDRVESGLLTTIDRLLMA
jgi:AcrR family transcriptional regulator